MFILAISLLMSNAFALQSAPSVQIEQGFLSGQYLQTVKGRTFSSFTGIPYAQPPVGPLRFEPPQPARSWQGVRNATTLHPICPQSNVYVGDYSVRGDEDCLYLNVYTPQLTCCDLKDLPVMIFLHGGGLITGEANFDTYPPNILLDKNVVLVVPNYRLGPMGFLSTGDLVVPGNNGFKDQNLAIQWVKRNILQFGGDLNRITLFGHAAGGSSAHFHMLSPMSKDLIHGVISQSGTVFSLWSEINKNYSQRNFIRLAHTLNCLRETTAEIIDCLKQVDAHDLIRAQDTIYVWTAQPVTPFRPVVEPCHEGAFLTDYPANIIKSGNVAKVPFMNGVTTEDGTLISAAYLGNQSLLEQFAPNFRELLPPTLAILPTDITAEHIEFIVDKIIEYYLDNKMVDITSIADLTKLYTDHKFVVPESKTINLHLNYLDQPIYKYALGYRTSVSFSDLSDPLHNYGVGHRDDLFYLFPQTKFFPNYVPNSSDKMISEIITTMWTNFAATGNPTPFPDPLIPEKWKRVSSSNLEYLSIRGPFDVRMDKNLYRERIEFLLQLLLPTYDQESLNYCVYSDNKN